MGMFDDIRFDFRMPDGYEPRFGTYQSKDLECDGSTYVVEAGRLVRTSHIDGDPAAGDVNFNGTLNIYTSTPAPGSARRVWHEYNLEFVDGALKVIHCDQTGMALLFEHCDILPPARLAGPLSPTSDHDMCAPVTRRTLDE